MAPGGAPAPGAAAAADTDMDDESVPAAMDGAAGPVATGVLSALAAAAALVASL